MSHELRTPLNSVIAFNTLIMDDEDSNCKVPKSETPNLKPSNTLRFRP